MIVYNDIITVVFKNGKIESGTIGDNECNADEMSRILRLEKPRYLAGLYAEGETPLNALLSLRELFPDLEATCDEPIDVNTDDDPDDAVY